MVKTESGRIRRTKKEKRVFKMTIKILVVDDHISVRKELRKVLNRNPQIEVVGEASGGKEALDLSKRLDPDVMLLDVEMPDMNGYEVAKRLTREGSTARVLAVSGYDEKTYILGMFANGAVGYLTKDEAPQHLMPWSVVAICHIPIHGQLSTVAASSPELPTNRHSPQEHTSLP